MTTSPLTLLRNVFTQWAHSLGVLATDGGTNDGALVEITGTSQGYANVTDGPVALVYSKDVDCTSAAKLTTTTGAGYIRVKNRDGSATVYIGASGVSGSTNGGALAAGESLTWRASDLSLVYAIGSSTVNVMVWQ